MAQHWFVCLLRCSDGSLYAGVSCDAEADIQTINAGGGSPWLKTRLPVFLAYSEEFMNEPDAEKRANAIRRMKREAKELLLVGPSTDIEESVPEWGVPMLST